jgi:hypothetical protein
MQVRINENGSNTFRQSTLRLAAGMGASLLSDCTWLVQELHSRVLETVNETIEELQQEFSR